MKRITAMLLAILTLFTLLAFTVSCGGDGGDDSSSKTPGGDGDEWYDALDFKGKTLTVSQSTNVWNVGTSIDNAAKYTMGPERIGSDEVQNLCYNRNNEVAKALNLKINYITTNLKFNEIFDAVSSYTKMAKSPADIVINDVYAVVELALASNLYNLCDKVSETNYLDLSKDCWYADYMNGLTLDENCLYGLAGDYFMDVIRSAHCLYVNTEYFEEACCSNGYESIDDFYAMVSGGAWTYDELIDLSDTGWVQSTMEPTASPDDEHIGLYLNDTTGFFPLVFGSGVSMVEKTVDGNYRMKNSTDDLTALSEAINKLAHANGVLLADGNTVFPNGTREAFTSGQCLFFTNCWLGDLEHNEFQAMEHKSVVVYPKWNSTQENYATYVHDSAEIGYIPRNTANFTAASAYLELINEWSTDVMQEYYQIDLKFKRNTESGGALTMIDLVHDTICSPFEQFIAARTGFNLYSTINEQVKRNTPDRVSAVYASVKDTTAAIELAELVRRFQTIE